MTYTDTLNEKIRISNRMRDIEEMVVLRHIPMEMIKEYEEYKQLEKEFNDGKEN